jgi:hypothetical protein
MVHDRKQLRTPLHHHYPHLGVVSAEGLILNHPDDDYIQNEDSAQICQEGGFGSS